ncbi:MAG TPA: response regulator transcription factor [Chitinophagaceae bacterium]|nr:response regulator transcription factor [Chitinophagaceae bacterium]
MDKEKQILIAIAEDYKIFREGIKKCISSDRNLEVILEAENGDELISGFEKRIPDVVIMDLKMPIMGGMEATQIIRKKFPNVKVLVITMYGEEKFIIHLMDIGANGYLLKNSEPEEIRRSIYAVHENGYYFNDFVNKALLKKILIKDYVQPSFNNKVELSEQELILLKLICEEKELDEIAKELNSNTDAIASVQQQLIGKIGVRNSAGLIMYAIKNGIVT